MTPKGHLNQTCKNVRSTNPKSTPFEVVHMNQLKGRKVQDVYTKIYHVRDTIFSDQTGQFPQGSQTGNTYIMVMVEIDSSAILIKPIKQRSDAEYRVLIRPSCSGYTVLESPHTSTSLTTKSPLP
jgi:hypothetical protein